MTSKVLGVVQPQPKGDWTARPASNPYKLLNIVQYMGDTWQLAVAEATSVAPASPTWTRMTDSAAVKAAVKSEVIEGLNEYLLQPFGMLRMFLTAGGQPSWFFGTPKMQIEDLVPDGSLGTGTHPAFITGAGEAKVLWRSAYLLTYKNGEMVSQPGILATANMTQQEEIDRCAATTIVGHAGHRAGSVWDVALQNAITRVLMQNGMEEPARNNSYGKDAASPHIQGQGTTSIKNGSMGSAATHNRQVDGISGNEGFWERFTGAFTQDGEIHCAVNNDPANLVSPASSGHFYTTGSSTASSAVIDITSDASAVVRNGVVGSDVNSGSYSYRTGAAGHASVAGASTAAMKLAGLAPLGGGADMNGGIYTRNYGLRAFLAFGSWPYGASAGPAALSSHNSPSFRYSSIAARSAFLEF